MNRNFIHGITAAIAFGVAISGAIAQQVDPAGEVKAFFDGVQRGFTASPISREVARAFLEDARVTDPAIWRALYEASLMNERRAVVLAAARACLPAAYDSRLLAGGVMPPAPVAAASDFLASAIMFEPGAPVTLSQERALATGDGANEADAARADAILGRTDAPPELVRGALHYFVRGKRATASQVDDIMARLPSEDPEIAGLSARALARAGGDVDASARVIAAAYVAGGDRVAQIDRLRALGYLAPTPAIRCLTSALDSTDPHLRRTAFETTAGFAVRVASPAKTMLTERALASIADDPVADVRRAAVLALLALDEERFIAELPRLRLADPWSVRSAAGEACAGRPDLVGRVRTFLEDPDRRVRSAVLEKLAEPVGTSGKPGDQAAQGVEREKLGLIPESMLRVTPSAEGKRKTLTVVTTDTVEVSLLAKLLAGISATTRGAFDGPDPMDFVKAVPACEVECLQSVIDYAKTVGGETGTRALERLAASPEIDTSAKAREALGLKTSGVRLRVDDLRRLYAAAWERVDFTHAHAVVRAKLRTNRGDVTLRLVTSEAPITVSNFVRLAKSGFYDGILWHRVVPAFVAQAGCPRGDGWGGPGYTIRCELNARPYVRGSVGMALAGKDTGGSQFFICHRATPHLDGRYTNFGDVESGMDVVDALVPGDVILGVTLLD